MTDFLDKLAEDARRLRVARKLPQGNIPPDLIRQVIDDFNRYLEQSGESLSAVSKALGKGFSQSVLSTVRQFDRNGQTKYTGKIDDIIRGINSYLEKAAIQNEAHRFDGFVETECAKHMLTIIRQAIKNNTMAMITGDSGRGKTTVLEACQQIYTGSIYLRVNSDCRSARYLARELADCLGVNKGRKRHMSAYDTSKELRSRLNDTNRLIMIDEAHRLKHDALEFVRDLHDQCGGLPIVLAGTRDIEDNIADQGIFFGQFASRVGLRFDVNQWAGTDSDRNGPGRVTKAYNSVDEIIKMFGSDKLRLTDDAKDFLFRMTNITGKGGLRTPKLLLQLVAGIRDGKPIDAKKLRSALNRCNGNKHLRDRMIRDAEQLKIKVA